MPQGHRVQLVELVQRELQVSLGLRDPKGQPVAQDHWASLVLQEQRASQVDKDQVVPQDLLVRQESQVWLELPAATVPQGHRVRLDQQVALVQLA